MKQNCEINEFQERTEKMKKIKKYIAVIPIALLFVLLTGIHVFGAETVLQQKKWVNDATFQSEADNTYYKINITKTGYIKAEYFLDREPEFTSNITLYDQNKKKLSKSSAMKKMRELVELMQMVIIPDLHMFHIIISFVILLRR